MKEVFQGLPLFGADAAVIIGLRLSVFKGYLHAVFIKNHKYLLGYQSKDALNGLPSATVSVIIGGCRSISSLHSDIMKCCIKEKISKLLVTSPHPQNR